MYSRITGYYRPVQNWNDGKAQEFRDRKVYDIGHSRLTHSGPVVVSDAPAAAEAPAVPEKAAEAPAAEPVKDVKNARALLFVSATCPNCKLAVSMLEKEGFLFKKILATENVDLTNQYGVRQAPTLVVLGPTPGEFTKYKGVSEIKGMLTARQAV